jgi:hypothetical protein
MKTTFSDVLHDALTSVALDFNYTYSEMEMELFSYCFEKILQYNVYNNLELMIG